MNDANTRRDNFESIEGLHPPFEELVSLAVSLKLHFEIPLQRIVTAVKIDLNGMVDDQIDRNQWLDQLGIFSKPRYG